MRRLLLALSGLGLTACATLPPHAARVQTADVPTAAQCVNAARTAPLAPVQEANWQHLGEPSLMSAQRDLARTERAAREQNGLYRRCMARAAG